MDVVFELYRPTRSKGESALANGQNCRVPTAFNSVTHCWKTRSCRYA